jgi:DUF4097 and DUF4098 domain-containing protein YvlB
MKIKSMMLIYFIIIATNIWAKTDINETRALSANGKLSIENISGSVVVYGWNKNEVSIKGTYGDGVERVDIISSANSVKIKVIYRFGFIFGGKCDLEINAPEKAGLNINTVSAKISVENFNADASIESISGKIDIKGNFPSLEARSTSGDLKIEGDSGNMEIRNTSGEITINGSGNDVDITSISGRVELDGRYLRIKAKTVSGRITINGDETDYADLHSTSGGINFDFIPKDKADIYAETTSGKIELNVPKNLSARIRLDSFSGRIKIDGIKYSNEDDGEEDDFLDISKSLRMTVGKGDARIYLQSLSGSISLIGK